MRAHPRGFSLVELTVAIFILMVVLNVALGAVSYSINMKRIQGKREAARETVMMTLERLRAGDPALLPASGQTRQIELPPALKPLLRGAVCEVRATADAAAPQLRRLHVEVHWPDAKDGESGEALVRMEKK